MQQGISPAQRDLLDAAFLARPEAASAWRRWSADVDWDGHLDHTSFALLPRAYRNLRALGVDDPIFPRCKGIMHQAWLANQRLIAGLGPGLDALAGAGIAPVLLPPTWVLARDRAAVLDHGRPLCWAIAPGQALAAIRALRALGWTSDAVQVPGWCLAGYIAGARHLVLRQPGGPRWMLTWEQGWCGDTPSHPAAAETCELGDRTMLALAPRDALRFLLCRPAGRGAFALAAELLSIADLGAVGDWPEAIPATVTGLPADWSGCMERLAHLFTARGAPPGFGQISRSAPPAVAAPPGKALARLATDWQRYRVALGAAASTPGLLVQLPGYLMGRWRLSRVWQLPGRALRWLLSRRVATGGGRAEAA